MQSERWIITGSLNSIMISYKAFKLFPVSVKISIRFVGEKMNKLWRNSYEWKWINKSTTENDKKAICEEEIVYLVIVCWLRIGMSGSQRSLVQFVLPRRWSCDDQFTIKL